MIIYDSYDNVLLETSVSDRSSLYCGLDNNNSLTLYFSLDRHVAIPVGSWCFFEGNRYELMSDADVKMNHTENYEYTVVFSSYFALLSRYKVMNIVDGRLKFDLVAKPSEHLKMIVDNLNARSEGWSVGNCIESVEKLVSYNHSNCEEALLAIADAFKTEIEVVGKSISLKKVEYFKDDPLALSYGKGNGFRPGIQKTSVKDGLPVQRLFVQGGSRNISLKEYGSSELRLPKGLSFGFDGEKFDGEDGFNEDVAMTFVTDADGMSVSVDDMTGGKEDSLDLSEVYPSRVGHVTGVVFVYKGNKYTEPVSTWTEDEWNEVQIDIVDSTIPDSLDFNECLLENDEPLSIVFQSGMLAGREFDATYVASGKKFELEKTEYDGQPMPQDVFIPKVGDSYAVFNVSLPESYISDAPTYSGAEYNLLREASKYLFEKCVSEFSFVGEVDGMWAKKSWSSIGRRLKIGSYVSFTHDKMFPDKPALVRIVGITQYVNNPHYPKIELSNSVGVSTVSSRLNQIENKDAHVDKLHEESRRYSKRRWADIRQTMQMLSAAFDNFSEGVNPVTVETMQAVVGDKSLQYVFVTSLDDDTQSDLQYEFDSDYGVFRVSRAFIKHMTLEIDTISPTHSSEEYLRWEVNAHESEILDGEKPYYLYAQVSKDSQQGNFLLSPDPIKIEAVEGYYSLLVGILNTEIGGERSFAPLYGYSEILPGQITTNVIRSSDGQTYFDLVRGVIGGNIVFKAPDGSDKSMSDFADEQDTMMKDINKTIDEMQDQIDGVVENHFYVGTPTTVNAPAMDWTTDEQKINHIGDTYTDIEDFIDMETTPDSGKSWRWCRCQYVEPDVVFEAKVSSEQLLGNIDASKRYAFIDVYYQPLQSDYIKAGTYDFVVDANIAVRLSSSLSVVIKIDSNTGHVTLTSQSSVLMNTMVKVVIRDDYVSAIDSNGETYKLHWHPIADTDAVKALLKAYELERRIDDAEYLKRAFSKGATEVSGGVVMSEIVAVRDEDEKIEAFLNGSELAKDVSGGHGKLILAAGIPDVSSNGSYDLDDRAREALTRIYEDGTIVTKNAHLKEGATIGESLVVGANGIVMYDDFGGRILINASVGYRAINKYGTIASMGGTYGQAIDVTTPEGAALGLGVSHAKPLGITVNAGDKEHAFECRSGLFAGMRTKTRVIASTSSTRLELDRLDYNVLITATSGTSYLKLPDTPSDGQEYIIETLGADINLSSSKRFWYHWSGEYKTTHTFTDRGVLRFKYYADAGIWTCTWLESR